MSMVPQGRSWLLNYDAFRTVPKDLAESSPAGLVMTMVAVMICSVLFISETVAFLTEKPATRIVIDSNEDRALRINFDLTMFDMACEHVTVGVWDAFGTDRQNITRNVQKQRIDHKGKNKGVQYTEDELAELEFADSNFSSAEKSELDSDWSSSSDTFKHDDFDKVVDAHDFTFVYFYADWCPPCMRFAPTWTEFEKKVNGGEIVAKDAEGSAANVRVLKLNCVDFDETCTNQKVHGFPTMRLYRRGTGSKQSYVGYEGERNVEGVNRFMQGEVAKRHLHTGSTFHEQFAEGCRISGNMDVARVPGTVHFQAQHTRENVLNLAFTNVSHEVNHFSFGEAPRRSIYHLPEEYKRHVSPLDGRSFTVDKFHQAPNHFIKVVHTRFEASGL
jgi:thiol-disulfide isomerase/thioredoxin